MIRFFFALVVSLMLTVAVRAAELPTGKWAVNIDGEKGDLVIKDVQDGKVTGSLLGTGFTGTWSNKTLTFELEGKHYEAHLVTEPGEKDIAKYTLTGTREENVRVKVKAGWYAQITTDAPATGEIKAEIRGILVQDEAHVYVSVKQKDKYGHLEETRVWVWVSEGEWKVLQHDLKPLYGKEVVVSARISQLPKDVSTGIPGGSLYFLDRFEPKLVDAPK